MKRRAANRAVALSRIDVEAMSETPEATPQPPTPAVPVPVAPQQVPQVQQSTAPTTTVK